MDKKTDLVLIGAGGTASHLIHPLVVYARASLPEPMIHIYDRDEVERKNLSRQLFYEHEIGKSKALALAERFPDITRSHLEYVGEDNIESVVKEDDIVLICADNMAVRRVINNRAKTLKNVVVINGGNEEHTGSVQLFIRNKGKNVTPSLDHFSPEFDAKNDKFDRSNMSCAEIAELPGGEQAIIANNTVAALMLTALWRLENIQWKLKFDPDKDTPQWTKFTFDHRRGTTQQSDVRLTGGYA